MKRRILQISIIILPILLFISLFEIVNIDAQRVDNSVIGTTIEISNEPAKTKAADLQKNLVDDKSIRQDEFISECLSGTFAIILVFVVGLFIYNKKGEAASASPL